VVELLLQAPRADIPASAPRAPKARRVYIVSGPLVH
jgi:hypothetical protein